MSQCKNAGLILGQRPRRRRSPTAVNLKGNGNCTCTAAPRARPLQCMYAGAISLASNKLTRHWFTSVCLTHNGALCRAGSIMLAHHAESKLMNMKFMIFLVMHIAGLFWSETAAQPICSAGYAIAISFRLQYICNSAVASLQLIVESFLLYLCMCCSLHAFII